MLNVLIVSGDPSRVEGSLSSEDIRLHHGQKENGRVPRAPKVSDLSRYDLAFVDLDTGGWQEQLLELKPHMPVVAFSAPDIRLAVDAMRLGAVDYIEKPLTDQAVQEVIARFRHQILDHRYGFGEMLGTSALMQEVFALIKRAAASESNVLITGDSGTGKELVARAIHRWSGRKDNAFLSVNCSAIPDSLLESELFGHEKGSFTGAIQTKKGILELADGGTVFLDEIGDVSPLFQMKVLRAIQEGEVLRIGGTRQIKIDVRIISATNRDLKGEILRGRFREDLFYRLNVINIHLPPLRERLEDVPVLVRHFLKKHSAKRRDLSVRGVSREALQILMSYPYPGNVRELENVIERAICLANSPEILPSDLPSALTVDVPGKQLPSLVLRDALRTAERETIEAALRQTDWNISHAASLLGIYRQQLQRKIKSLKLAPEKSAHPTPEKNSRPPVTPCEA
ncbi:MAG: sigma 54-interacting transcriptional regulator [Chloroflexota bacterium]